VSVRKTFRTVTFSGRPSRRQHFVVTNKIREVCR